MMSSSEDSRKLVKLLLGLIFLLMELVEIVDALRIVERSKFDVAEVTRGGPGAGEKTELLAVEPSSLEDSKKVASAISVTDVLDKIGRVFADIKDCIDFRVLIVFLSRLFLSSVAPRQLGSRGTRT